MKLFILLIVLVSVSISIPPQQVASQSDRVGIIFDKTIVYGGSNFETGCDISYFNGNYFITGDSFSPDFPATGSDTHNQGSDFFVTKVNMDTGDIVWNRMLGGNRTDFSYENSIDGAGNIYLVGSTESLDFLQSESLAISSIGAIDIYLLKMSALDGEIQWVRLLGGTENDYGFGSILDNDGNIIVTGHSISPDFQVSSGFQQIASGSNAILAKYSPEGDLLWSRTFGGSDTDQGYMTRIDQNNNIYLLGDTYSNDLPNNTEDRIDTDFRDGFIAKFDTDGKTLWSKYLGGNEHESVVQIELNTKEIYILGTTRSIDYPLLNPYMEKTDEFPDFFITRLSFDGEITWSTVFGGTDHDNADAMSLTSKGGIVIAGATQSNDIPLLNQIDSTLDGSSDMLIAEFSSEGSLEWSTYFGGSDADVAETMLVVGDQLVIAGNSRSSNFPGSNEQITNGEAQVIAVAFNFTQSVPLETNSKKSSTAIQHVVFSLVGLMILSNRRRS